MLISLSNGQFTVNIHLSSHFKAIHNLAGSVILKMSPDLGTRLSDIGLRGLYTALWSWAVCAECTTDRGCRTSNCPSQRLQRLVRFSRYYAEQCMIYIVAAESSSEWSLKKHADLWWIIEHLRQNPRATKESLINVVKEALTRGPGTSTSQIPETDLGLAIDLAVRISTMVNCFSQPRGVSILEQGLHQLPWQNDVPFDMYIESLFPAEWDTHLKRGNRDISDEIRSKITAGRLKKDLGLTFRPTDNLASHLKLDRQSNVLEIFQHTAFLKEHLRLTKDAPHDLSVTDSLRLYV